MPVWPVIWIVNTLIIGTLVLAIIDENVRSAFIDLAQVGLGGYMTLLLPYRNQEQSEK